MERILTNNNITSLQIVNTNVFIFDIISIGPIRVSWGDGSYTNVPIKLNRTGISKTYTAYGTYNITITNPENITSIYIVSTLIATKINTNVIWFKQFKNLIYLQLENTTFIGDLATVIDTMINLNWLAVSHALSNSFLFNVSNCKTFWQRALYINLTITATSFIGNSSDININNACQIAYFQNLPVGNWSGIIKNGYTALQNIYIFTYQYSDVKLMDIDTWIIPNTMLAVNELQGNNIPCSNLVNFNFNNLTKFQTALNYGVDLSNNTSFVLFASKCTDFAIRSTNYDIKIPLNLFTKETYTLFRLQTAGVNLSYGDITNLISNTISSFWLMGNNLSTEITGSIPEITAFSQTASIAIQGCSITASRTALLNLIAKAGDFVLSNIPTINCNINGADFRNARWGFFSTSIYNMANLEADITTFIFNPATYGSNAQMMFRFDNNPKFTGNLENLPLWGNNKATLNFSSCAYTGIPGFINKIFTNRNTCFKSNLTSTGLSIQNNVDNNLLTGISQWPNLGTYTGSVHNLTESQIDNLSQGLDYTGTGTNTPWTHKEKIYFLTNCNNSSTDNSKRYRVTITY